MLLAFILAILPPAELVKMVQVGCVNSQGWGTPISSNQILTAAHVVDKCSGIFVKDYMGRTVTTARVLWSNKRGYPDVALIMTETPQAWGIVTISKGGLEAGEDVFWVGYLKGMLWAPFSGKYVGTDEDRDMVIDGWVGPGVSGSGLLNAKGELVGVMLSLFSLGGSAAPVRSLGAAVRIDRWPN